MEIAFLIGGILIGGIGALTVYNTVKLRDKKTATEPMSDKERRIAEDVEAMMNYRGRA